MLAIRALKQVPPAALVMLGLIASFAGGVTELRANDSMHSHAPTIEDCARSRQLARTIASNDRAGRNQKCAIDAESKCASLAFDLESSRKKTSVDAILGASILGIAVFFLIVMLILSKSLSPSTFLSLLVLSAIYLGFIVVGVEFMLRTHDADYHAMVAEVTREHDECQSQSDEEFQRALKRADVDYQKCVED